MTPEIWTTVSSHTRLFCTLLCVGVTTGFLLPLPHNRLNLTTDFTLHTLHSSCLKSFLEWVSIFNYWFHFNKTQKVKLWVPIKHAEHNVVCKFYFWEMVTFPTSHADGKWWLETFKIIQGMKKIDQVAHMYLASARVSPFLLHILTARCTSCCLLRCNRSVGLERTLPYSSNSSL